MIDPPVVVGVPVATTVVKRVTLASSSLDLYSSGSGSGSGSYSPFVGHRVYRGDDTLDTPRETQCSCLWALACAGVVLVAVIGSTLSGSQSTGIETVWLAPSLCPIQGGIPGGNVTQYASFVDSPSPATGMEEDNLFEADEQATAVGAACPAEAKPVAQEFTLPSTLSWAVPGHNESFVVFRGDDDYVVLSYTLRDADGTLLLSAEAVELGSPPETISANGGPARHLLFSRSSSGPSSSGGDPATYKEEDEEEEAAARLGAGRPTSRRLLKGGAHGAHGASAAYSHPGRLSHLSIGRPWGSAAGAPHRTSFGHTARRAILAGAG